MDPASFLRAHGLKRQNNEDRGYMKRKSRGVNGGAREREMTVGW
jgi:hypothetical protein